MANPEHLKILKEGVEAWNKWRGENPNLRPDLSAAYLGGADLDGAQLYQMNMIAANLAWANLSGAFLMNTELREGKLNHAKLSHADLQSADLTDADLSGATLQGADLRGAVLTHANLATTDLRGAQFVRADLSGARLAGANVSYADLEGSLLARANLREAFLRGADLQGASLKDADLFMALLDHADLWNANMEGANLRNAVLRGCSLTRTNLTDAVLTGVKLYGSSRDDWIIKDVKCDYIFWDREGKQRSPKDRDLEPGEFERLYASLPTIEYVFEHGMSPLDPLIMDRVVQGIREKRPEFDIKIDSINARGLAPSIKFTVQHEEQKGPALEEVWKGYEIKLKQLECERDRYWELIKAAFDKPREVKLISAGPGAIVATDGSTINIQQHIHNAIELQKAIAQEPVESKTFAKIAKNKALDIIGKVLEDIAKGQVKEAAKQIIELGKDLGPIIAKTAAYAFFRSMM